MEYSKEELVKSIETARQVLDKSIEERRDYGEIYQNSVELDRLIERYVDSEY